MFKNLSTSRLGIAGVQSEIIELAVSFGFKAIELDLPEFELRTEAKGFDYAIRLIKSAEMNLGYFVLPVAWQDSEERYQEDLAKLAGQAEIAARVGCPRAVTLLSPYSDERPYHENFEFHRKRLGEIADVLGQHGVRLGLGFQALPALRKDRAFEFVHTFDELVKLAGSISEGNVGIVLDVWQRYVAGSSDAELEALTADQIVSVNLADAPADVPLDELTDEQRLLPGASGVVDSGAVARRLVEIEYPGPVTAKPHASAFQKAGRVDIVRALGQALEDVWVAAGLSEPRAAPLAAPPSDESEPAEDSADEEDDAETVAAGEDGQASSD